MDKLSSFVHKGQFHLIYPVILLLGELASLLLSEEALRRARSLYWFSSRNFINKLFAHEGNIIFTLALLLIRVARFRTDTTGKKLYKEYFVKLFIKQVALYLLFLIIDHLFLATGGACIIDPNHVQELVRQATSPYSCSRIYGSWDGICSLTSTQLSSSITDAQVCRQFGHWEGGFDISGHFCFLVTLSLILWNDLRLLVFTGDIENQVKPSKFVPLTIGTTLGLIIIWAQILLVTATFYHTLLEKILGLCMGYITPYLLYHHRYTYL